MAQRERLTREAVNYASIAKLKAQINTGKKIGEKANVTDFLALARNNDPFYAAAPRGVTWGRWFVEQWQEHKGHLPTVHVRSLHYALVGRTNSASPVVMPDGKVYENTLTCWKKLEAAGKFARNNQYIDAERFEDRRAQSLTERIYEEPDIYIGMVKPDISFDFPPFPDFPAYTLSYKNRQRYRLEVWCEKSTQESILLPISEQYQITMLSAQGELSISAILKAIRRADRSGLPTRILYISDFDPAGRSMPVAASRKLEFWQSVKRSRADMQLYPIALTHDQCIQYRLERTPIKESERRKAKFEDRYGSGATELDALEAEHPGELANLLEQEILRYYDASLEERTQDREALLRDHLASTQEGIQAGHEEEYLQLYAEYFELRKEFYAWVERRCTPWQARLDQLWDTIAYEMGTQKPDLSRYALPAAKEVPPAANCLYMSTRDYLEQLAAYRTFTGKFAELIEEEDEEDA